MFINNSPLYWMARGIGYLVNSLRLWNSKIRLGPDLQSSKCLVLDLQLLTRLPQILRPCRVQGSQLVWWEIFCPSANSSAYLR